MKLKIELLVMIVLSTLLFSVSLAQDDSNVDNAPNPFGAPPIDRPIGLTKTSDLVTDGYILIPIIQSKDVILIDNEGTVVNTWQGDLYTGASAYLYDNGDLLRTSSLDDLEDSFGYFNGQWGFIAGQAERRTWDNELVWSLDLYDGDTISHHDIEPMPNGNVLVIMFERKTAEEALAAGHNPDLLHEDPPEIWNEKIVEIVPETGEIVWEWSLWDHLVQDFDENADNYGVIAENPRKVNVNFLETDHPIQMNWWHVNAIDYNAELDQIVISPRTYSEIWIIDHSISTEEARGEAGDLLYRWGNPKVYGAGTDEDRELFFQHDPTWIPDGLPGAGNITIFDNGGAGRYDSRIVEIAPQRDENGDYILPAGEPPAPETLVWEYIAENPVDFYSPYISGAERQANGNTLITEGLNGRLFSVTPEGEIVWEYYLTTAAWAFRGERYNLPVFADLELDSDTFVGGVIWGRDCADGTQPRLHEYIIQENADMQLFIDTYGEDAQATWEEESCAEHGGIAN